jgi:hypothetical protein
MKSLTSSTHSLSRLAYSNRTTTHSLVTAEHITASAGSSLFGVQATGGSPAGAEAPGTWQQPCCFCLVWRHLCPWRCRSGYAGGSNGAEKTGQSSLTRCAVLLLLPLTDS